MFETVSVLVVDDQAVIRKTLQIMLESIGCKTVYLAENGRDALAHVEADHPDLIICDVRMSPMNGIEFLRHLRHSSGPEAIIPVIMLTSQSPEETAAEMGDDMVPDAYLQKPVGATPLKQVVASIMAGRES